MLNLSDFKRFFSIIVVFFIISCLSQIYAVYSETKDILASFLARTAYIQPNSFDFEVCAGYSYKNSSFEIMRERESGQLII